MKVSIKSLALESENIHDDALDRLLTQVHEVELNDADFPEEGTGMEMSFGPKGTMRLKRIPDDLKDMGKALTAWTRDNDAKIGRIRADIRAARSRLSSQEPMDHVFGDSLLTYLGDLAHGVSGVKSLISVIETDLANTERFITKPAVNSANFARNLTTFICEKDNDFKWGYQEGVDGSRRIIEKNISDLVNFGVEHKVESFDWDDLKTSEGTMFSPLMLGNVVTSTNWSERHETAKHLDSAAAALGEYVHGMHDLIHIPKHGNKYALNGGVDKKQLEQLLDAAEEYLNHASRAARSLQDAAAPVIGTQLASNWFTNLVTALAASRGVVAADMVLYKTAKFFGSRNYRRLYVLMRCCLTWSMKLQRKAATRNQDMAKHLVSFVKTNLK